MANTIKFMHGYIVYFLGMFLLVTLFSIAGVFQNNEVIVDQRFSTAFSGGVNSSASPSAAAPTGLSAFKWNSYFKDVFSFFFWNISIYEDTELMNWLWMIRLLFVYLPLLGLLIAIWYSVPTVNG